eukprot:1159687-Pelagomonas_calceolata.AAC.4
MYAGVLVHFRVRACYGGSSTEAREAELACAAAHYARYKCLSIADAVFLFNARKEATATLHLKDYCDRGEKPTITHVLVLCCALFSGHAGQCGQCCTGVGVMCGSRASLFGALLAGTAESALASCVH